MTGQSATHPLAARQRRRPCIAISHELMASIHRQTRLFWD